jgi:hypothetical protein
MGENTWKQAMDKAWERVLDTGWRFRVSGYRTAAGAWAYNVTRSGRRKARRG